MKESKVVGSLAVVLLALACGAPGASGQQTPGFYVLGIENSQTKLFTLELNGMVVTPVGPAGQEPLDVMGYDPVNDWLVCSGYPASSRLYHVDTSTGAATPFPQTSGWDRVNGVEFVPPLQGMVVVVGTGPLDDVIGKLNSDGTVTQLWPAYGFDLDDLAWDETRQLLYAADWQTGAVRHIDINTGNVVATVNFGIDVIDRITVVDGILYAVDNQDHPSPTLRSYDPVSGALISDYGTIDGVVVHGIAAAPIPGNFRFSADSYSVAENGGSVLVTVLRDGGGTGSVGVSYSTGGGSAVAGADYDSTAGTLSWPDGDTSSRSFSIPVIDNNDFEPPDKTILVSLSAPSGGATIGSPGAATVTILDNDFRGFVSFSSAAYSFSEADGHVTVTVNRTGSGNGVLSVSCSTIDGTAQRGADFGAVPANLFWEDGDMGPKEFHIVIYNDSDGEGDESLQLSLSNPGIGGGLGSVSSATVTIRDDDPIQDSPVCAGPRILLHLMSPTATNVCSRARIPCENAIVNGGLYPPNTYFAYVLVAGAPGAAADGIAGVQLGIDFGSGPQDGVGVDVFSWNLCAFLEFGGFQSLVRGDGSTPIRPGGGGPHRELGTLDAAAAASSGGSNLITWNWTSSNPERGCQRAEPGGPGTGVVAVAGYFYVAAYTPASMSVIPRPVDNIAAVTTCPHNFSQFAPIEVDVAPEDLGSVGFGSEVGYNPCMRVPPPAPATCSMSDGQMSGIFTWSAVPEAAKYLVYRDTSLIAVLPGGTTSYEDFAVPGTYTYSVRAATCVVSEPCSDTGRVSAAENPPATSPRFVLFPPANPASLPVEIAFEIPAPTDIRLEIFGVDGRLVQVMAGEGYAQGAHRVVWDGLDRNGRPVPTGLYFIRLAGPNGVQIQRVVLLR